MKILVTGATGFIGQHVVAQLCARGHEVVASARSQQKAIKMAWYRDVNFIPCDLHDTTVDPVALLGIPEAMMHLAWPGLPNYKSRFHFEVNLPVDYRFIKSMVLAGTQQILVAGTCFEYGMQSGPLAEDTPTSPNTFYGLAKDTLRKYLQILQAEYPFVLQWVRLFYMYGPGQNPNSLFAQLDRAIDAGVKVFNMSGGEQLRDYLPVDEVARRLVRIIEQPVCAGVINCCSGQPISIRRLVERRIAEQDAGIRLNTGYYPYLDYEPMAFWGDGSKFLSNCGADLIGDQSK